MGCTACRAPARRCCGRSRSAPTASPRRFATRYGWFSGLIHAKSENARLRRQVDRLTQLSIQNATAAQQVQDYRRQLHYVGLPRFPQDYNYVATDVISRPPSEFQQQIGIAAGSSSGIRVNDPVVTPDGLVGTISQVTGHQAQVTLLTDPNLYVSAFDLNTQAAGVVSHGQGQGTLTLNRVPKSAVLREGDTIVTQGWKNRQPQLDLPVRHPDRVRQRRLEPRGRPLLERAGRTAGELRFAAQRARAGPEEAEPAVSVNLLEPLKVAVLVFVASILQVTIFSPDRHPRRLPRRRAADAGRDRAPARLDLRRGLRLLRGADRRHGEPRHARRHLAAADDRRLLDRPLRRDDRPRPRARAVRLGRGRHGPRPVRRADHALPARRPGLREDGAARDAAVEGSC